MMQAGFRGKVLRAGIISVLVFIALLIPELVARRFLPEWASDEYVFFIANPETGWTHPPSTQLQYKEAVFNTNHLGIRNDEIGVKNKPRLLFIGDSFTWGWGIQNSERFTRHLQDRLISYELINAGITGYGTLQEFFFLQSTYQEIRPDMIVLQMYANDFNDNVTPKGVFPHPYLDWQHNFQVANHPVPKDAISLRVLNYFLHNTCFYRQLILHLYSWIFSFAMTLPVDWSDKTPEPARQDEIEGMRHTLTLLFSFCQEKKLPLLVFTYGMDDEQFATIQSVSSSFGIASRALEPALQGATGKTDLGDQHAHWNAYGSQLIANFMYPFIASNLPAPEKTTQ